MRTSGRSIEMDLWQLSAATASRMMAAGELSCEEYTRSFVERIGARDSLVRAWAWVDPDHALRQARELDRQPRRSPLHGIPLGVKDVFNTADMPTQHNSPIYEGHRPGEDANAVAVLRACGAVILGKTETLEFASGGRKPLSRNPRNTGHTPGGSSTGSGAAVGDGMVPLALGTQTGGSTIRPAAFCGIYGMKPTFGRISFEGAKHYSVHLDTVGFFGRCSEDLWLLARAFRLVEKPEPAVLELRGMRIGVCETPLWNQAQPDAQAALLACARLLSAAGANVSEFVLPEAFSRLTEQQDIIMHEGGRGAFIPEYLGAHHLLHDDFRAKVENRRGFASAQMRSVLDEVAMRRIDFERVFGDLDAVLTLSAPGEAPEGIRSQGEATFNRMWTALHVPCINIPGMIGRTGLPIGIQLIQKRYEDEKLVEIAATVAREVDAGAVAAHELSQ
jgi:Asp-tRNA(Asn)/Glu-tRNA(Gln) amidotransferase A subunit family amidase